MMVDRSDENGRPGAPLPVETQETEEQGGDPACWAELVCPECGAITTGGHRDGCPAKSLDSESMPLNP